jgi:hypothetical protein
MLWRRPASDASNPLGVKEPAMDIRAALTVALITFFVLPAQAEDTELAKANKVSMQYNECVYFSAVEHISEANGDISAAAEKAFASCKSEYDQMVSMMQTWGLLPERIEAILLEKKTGIKRELRNMMLEAKGLTKPAK